MRKAIAFDIHFIEYSTYDMYTVWQHKRVLKTLRKAPLEVKRSYVAWKRIVEVEGPQGLRFMKGFHDESLKGEWKGYRSSRLGNKWRVIYTRKKQEKEAIMKKINKGDFTRARDPVDMTPGEMLATLRNLQELTQMDLAERTGMTQANISNMESGRQQIGRERALVLAKALKVHPAVILFPSYQVDTSITALQQSYTQTSYCIVQ